MINIIFMVDFTEVYGGVSINLCFYNVVTLSFY